MCNSKSCYSFFYSVDPVAGTKFKNMCKYGRNTDNSLYHISFSAVNITSCLNGFHETIMQRTLFKIPAKLPKYAWTVDEN